MSMFQCPNSNYTELNSCNNNLPRQLCLKDDGTTYSVCGTKCPNVATKPNINWVWQYSDGSNRTYNNNPAYFDTPYGGLLSNAKYPRFQGVTITIGNQNTTSNTAACYNVVLDNTNDTYGVNGFLLSIQWPKASAHLLTWDFPEYNNHLYNMTSSTQNGFRITGNNQTGYMRVQPYTIGVFCLHLDKTGFTLNNFSHFIDAYNEVLFCDVNPNNANPCTVFNGK